ncbi:unnamed protein product [Meganyctiphanes norvegica]|uniref:Protein hunchback n=1 Tax=Meganyctiphanes norvegica TaxID=48144 RepID=A0AAV2QJ95_MEGNR
MEKMSTMQIDKQNMNSLRILNQEIMSDYGGDIIKEEMPLDYEDDYIPDNITTLNSFICDCGKRIETPLFTWPHILIENNLHRMCNDCQNKPPVENSIQNVRSSFKYKSKPKIFRCTQCSYSCDRNSNLKTHMLTHTGDKPFKCSSCKYRCTQKAHLVKHMLTHTVDKPFKVKCSECGTNFKNNTDLDDHMLTHIKEKTGDFLHRCPDCWYGFSEKAEFDSHTLYCKQNLYKSKEIILNDHAISNYDEDFLSFNSISVPYEITHPQTTAEIRKFAQNKLSTLLDLTVNSLSAETFNSDITTGYIEGYMERVACDCGNQIENLENDKCTKCQNELEESIQNNHINVTEQNDHINVTEDSNDTDDSPANVLLLENLEMINIDNEGKMFKCPYCEYKCDRKSNVKTHILIHTGDKPFKCEVCGHRCKQRGHLITHMLTHSNEKPFVCKICNSAFKRNTHLKTHMEMHVTEKEFECINCSFTCQSKFELKDHQVICKYDDKPFKCSQCDYECDRVSNLKTHMLTHTGDKPFHCTNCSYKCTQKAHLIKHLQTHRNDRLFKCSECDCSFKLKSQLTAHLDTHTNDVTPILENNNTEDYNNAHNLNESNLHESEDNQIIDSRSSSLVNELPSPTRENEDVAMNNEQIKETVSNCTCRTPSGIVITKNEFGELMSKCISCICKIDKSPDTKSNKNENSKQSEWDCSECGKSFDNKINLHRHLHIHTGYKPFSCPHCPYRCDRKSNLNTHILTHTGDKPFVCNICHHRSKQKIHLMKHMLTHTKERPFACTECEKTFQRKMQLNKHKLLHKIM